MPAIRTTDWTGEITWLGQVAPDVPDDRVNSQARDRLEMDWGGIVGEHHHGRNRASCVRVTMLHTEGTEIANVRQLSILSQEEIDAIAARMGLEALNPEWLGASMVLKGIPDFSHIPPSSRLQAASGLTLVVDMENLPCIWPAKEIERDHAGLGKAFKPAAEGRRGVTAWVERPGAVALGDRLRLYVPDQRPWAP